MVELQARPYRHKSDNYLALASSFSLLMFFICCMVFKYHSLTESEEIQRTMSREQRDNYIMSPLLLSAILIASVVGSLASAGVLIVLQLISEKRKKAGIRHLRYVQGNQVVELPALKQQHHRDSKSHSSRSHSSKSHSSCAARRYAT